MMSLVDYGSESEEDVELDEEQVEASKEIKVITTPSTNTFKSESAFLLKFGDLPEPQPEAPQAPEEFPEEGPIPPKKVYDDMEIEEPPGKTDNVKSFGNLTAKKVGGVMKIAAPSLKDFEEDEDESGKKKLKLIQQSQKRSGLFAILPEPKMPVFQKPKSNIDDGDDEVAPLKGSTADSYDDDEEMPAAKPVPKSKPFVPHVVQQTMLGKRPAPSKLDEIKAKYLKQEANVEIVSRKNKKQAEEKNESDEEGADFFSFSSAKEQIRDDPSLRLPDYVPPEEIAAAEAMSAETNEEVSQYVYQPPSDEDALKYINEGKKLKKENIKFIDVSADVLRPDATEWIKNITAEDAGYNATSSGSLPGGLSKRKHQITYLAQQARVREQELKNQWAQNRHNKRMTQSKYGF